MIQLRSIIDVADNTGAKKLAVIQVYGRSNRKIAQLGDIVTCSVKKADPNGLVKTHEMVKAVLVRTKKEKKRSDGSYIRFDDNAVVIITNVKDRIPKGTRIFGPVSRELKDLGYDKIVSLAQEVY